MVKKEEEKLKIDKEKLKLILLGVVYGIMLDFALCVLLGGL